MKKAIIPSITYMRGLCMLGVIAIHVGSYALTNPTINIHLLGILEIASRFTVPAFFFVSAFGLFYHTSVDDDFSYTDFLRRRCKVVLYPYVTWSILYTIYQSIVAHNMWGLMPHVMGLQLLFGNSMYHLYFLVILLWFYLGMPLWRYMVRLIIKAPLWWMTVGFLLQMGVNYWFSYYGGSIQFSQEWLQYIYSMRLNYWVIFYVWIFLLGAIIGERFDAVMDWLEAYKGILTIGFILSLLLMLGSYYYVMDQWHYTRLEAIYTIHQLSPQGLLYTGLGCVFFLWAFSSSSMSDMVEMMWQELGNASYGIYLVHPFMLILVDSILQRLHGTYDSLTVVSVYASVLILSYAITKGIDRLSPSIRSMMLGK